MLTEQQKFIRDELSHKSRLVRIDKIIKELGVTDVPDFISDLNALEKEGEVILSKKNNVQSVMGSGLVKAKIVSMSRGYCFAKPDDGGEDVYINVTDAMGALPGDRVIISVSPDEKGASGRVRSVYRWGQDCCRHGEEIPRQAGASRRRVLSFAD